MSEFVFLYPLWLVALFPLALLLIWLLRRDQKHSLIAPHLARGLRLQRVKQNPLFIGILALTWLVTIVALAGPSWQKQMRPSVQNSHGRVLIMDMSQSMYASDIKPNRLTQARYKALDLLRQWNEGSTGLVAYAADAYVVSPMTSDSATIANLLPNLSPDIMPVAGADAARGVELAISMMKNAGLTQGDIILFADDIDNKEMRQISALLKGGQWHLIMLAMGTPDGAPVTLSDGRLLQTNDGQLVIAKTNTANMRSLAEKVSGELINLQPDNSDVERIISLTKGSFNQLNEKNQQSVEERVNNGFWLVGFLLIPAVLLFRRGMIFTLAFCSLLTLPVHHAEASVWLNQAQQAKRAYDQQQYTQAAELFADPNWRGVAQYQAGQYAQAIDSLSQIAQPTPEQQYNLANAYAQNGDYQKALDHYDQLLKQRPNYADAEYNRKIVADALKQQQQQQQQQQQSPSQKQQSGQDKQDQQQPSDGQQSGQDKQQPQSSGGQQSGQDKQQSQSSDGQQSGQDKQQPQSSDGQQSGQDKQQSQSSGGQQSGQDKQQSQSSGGQQSGQDKQQSQPADGQQSGQDKQQQQSAGGQQSGQDKQQQQPSDGQQSGQDKQQPQSSGGQQSGQDEQQQQSAGGQQSGQDKQQQPSGGQDQPGQQQSAQQHGLDSQSGQQTDLSKKSESELTGSQVVNQQTELQTVDPALRRLEQVENARDPAELLRAQLYLQSQQKNRSIDKDKTW